MELVTLGHPKVESKLRAGVQAVVIGLHPMYVTNCFQLVRPDGSREDFSYRKCVCVRRPSPLSLPRCRSPGVRSSLTPRPGQWGINVANILSHGCFCPPVPSIALSVLRL